MAVCQEVPILDSPDYEVRLEETSGTVVRPLYRIGDGDPCREIAWSGDARPLVVLTSHGAGIRFVDVAWALSHTDADISSHFWPQVDIRSEKWSETHMLWVHCVRFVSADAVDVDVCPYQLPVRVPPACAGNTFVKRSAVPN